MISKSNSLKETPSTTDIWQNYSEEHRISLVENLIKDIKNYSDFKIKSAEKNGFVTLIIKRQIPANERGIMLLDLESLIKDNIDDGISIWLEPVGDKSKLRNLRGINFKKDV